MEIRKFRTKYNLELIPASHEGITLGDLVWDPIIGPPDFSRKGMPNTIFTAFLDAELVQQHEWEQFRKESKQTPLINAGLATRTINVSVHAVHELQQPIYGKISAEFTSGKVIKFSFGDLQVREMDDLMRVKIDRILEKMKATRWRDYDSSIRRVFMITELYYGTVKIVIDKKFTSELETILKKHKVQIQSSTGGGEAVEYSFSHNNVPFAMRIERIRNFNG